MTNRVQTLRSSVAGNVPATGTRQPGELWVNFNDWQFGFIDASQIARQLMAVRFFSGNTAYAPGDCVWNAGSLYAANVAVAAGAFNPAQWTLIGGQNVGYLPIGGGTLTGPLTVNGLLSAKTVNAMVASYDRGNSGGNTTQAFGIYRDANLGRLWIQEKSDLITFAASTGTATFLYPVTVQASLQVSVSTASTPQLVGNSFGFFGSLPNGNCFAGCNVYGEASTGTWRIGNTHATLGYGVFQATPTGCFWGGATGSVTAGAAVTPTIYKLWSQGDGTPVWAAGGSTMTGTTTLSGTFSASGAAQIYYGGDFGSAVGASSLSSATAVGNNRSIALGLWAGGAAGYSSIYDRVDRTDCNLAYFGFGASTGVGTITTNGSATAYNTTCDVRLKENVRPLASEIDCGALIDRLAPVAFEWKAKRDTLDGKEVAIPALPDHGFVAQDLHKVAPGVVTPGVGEIPWGADYAKLVPYLVAELQLLRQRVAQLEAH